MKLEFGAFDHFFPKQMGDSMKLGDELHRKHTFDFRIKEL